MNKVEGWYRYVENKDSEWQGIGLTEKAGKYQGVVYRYGEVTFAEEENEDGTLNLSFEWDILDSNGLPKESFGDDFFDLIGDVLVDIIDKHAKEGNIRYENRDNDTLPIDSQ